MTSRIDVSGQSCPIPVLRAKVAIDELASGDVLEVVSTDRGSLSDLPAWAESLGHRVLSITDAGDRFEFRIEKCSV